MMMARISMPATVGRFTAAPRARACLRPVLIRLLRNPRLDTTPSKSISRTSSRASVLVSGESGEDADVDTQIEHVEQHLEAAVRVPGEVFYSMDHEPAARARYADCGTKFGPVLDQAFPARVLLKDLVADREECIELTRDLASLVNQPHQSDLRHCGSSPMRPDGLL